MRLKCRHCNWIGDLTSTLTAPHPFQINNVVNGCPHCHNIECFGVLCEEPTCRIEAAFVEEDNTLLCQEHFIKD